MDELHKYLGKIPKPLEADFFKLYWEKSFTYIKTVVDVMQEAILILDKDLHVMAANESFYQTFKTGVKDTEGKIVYELGDGQWDIPELRSLLETILPKHTFFKGFQVAHEFPSIGRKVMILNAREIHVQDDSLLRPFPPIILLAMEDVTEMMVVAEALSERAQQIETSLNERIGRLEKEISSIRNIPRKRQ